MFEVLCPENQKFWGYWSQQIERKWPGFRWTVKLTVPPRRQELKLTWTVIYHWKRKPHFSSEHLSKTGYWLGVCHGWFHLHWIIRHVMSANRESQNENSWSVWDSNPGPSVRSEVAMCCAPRSNTWQFNSAKNIFAFSSPPQLQRRAKLCMSCRRPYSVYQYTISHFPNLHLPGEIFTCKGVKS